MTQVLTASEFASNVIADPSDFDGIGQQASYLMTHDARLTGEFKVLNTKHMKVAILWNWENGVAQPSTNWTIIPPFTSSP